MTARGCSTASTGPPAPAPCRARASGCRSWRRSPQLHGGRAALEPREGGGTVAVIDLTPVGARAAAQLPLELIRLPARARRESRGFLCGSHLRLTILQLCGSTLVSSPRSGTRNGRWKEAHDGTSPLEWRDPTRLDGCRRHSCPHGDAGTRHLELLGSSPPPDGASAGPPAPPLPSLRWCRRGASGEGSGAVQLVSDASASASGTAGRPSASATAGLTTFPATVLTPRRGRRRRRAPRPPRGSASATT